VPAVRDEIPPGTLYLLILKTLARNGELHGFEIANSIQQTTETCFRWRKVRSIRRCNACSSRVG
jgi:DNA-binding PadR family transcriptional regulator